MLCPGCQSSLQVEVVGGIHIDVCTTCAGVWFDESELGRFVALDEVTTEVVSAKLSGEVKDMSSLGRRCPKCEIVLDSYHYAYHSPYLIDSCSKCNGIFVDQSELRGIEHYHETARDDGPSQEAALGMAKLQYDMIVAKE
ncbi:MAG: zf-TFIIB domain-containing protein, partial [Armatimonadetes bacterium]|nr:zf-TFIIB domain-containing protein [Armatimonadota bacterium]